MRKGSVSPFRGIIEAEEKWIFLFRLTLLSVQMSQVYETKITHFVVFLLYVVYSFYLCEAAKYAFGISTEPGLLVQQVEGNWLVVG